MFNKNNYSSLNKTYNLFNEYLINNFEIILLKILYKILK